MSDDPHAEWRGTPSDFLSDATEARQPERLVTQLLAKELLLLPLPALHRPVGSGDVSGQCEHQSDGELRHAHAVRARSVHHDDATGGRRRDVDVIDAGAGARDRTELRRFSDESRRHFRGAPNDDRVGLREVGRELVGCPPGTSVDIPSLSAQQVERGDGKIISDNDFHERSDVHPERRVELKG